MEPPAITKTGGGKMVNPTQGPSQKPYSVQTATLTGQQKAMLKRAIQVAQQGGHIDGKEAASLNKLIDEGYGYITLLKDYIVDFKRNGKSMDDFVNYVKKNVKKSA